MVTRQRRCASAAAVDADKSDHDENNNACCTSSSTNTSNVFRQRQSTKSSHSNITYAKLSLIVPVVLLLNFSYSASAAGPPPPSSTITIISNVISDDAIGEVSRRMQHVSLSTANDECQKVPNLEKMLPRNAVSDLPLPFEPQGGVQQFRAVMYESQRVAVNRAIFYSFALQNATVEEEPDLAYYFFSTLATVSANEEPIVGSRIVFAKDALTASWFNTNVTAGHAAEDQNVSAFAPYAYRTGNNYYRAVDLAANGSAYHDETKHKTPNPWYAAWLSERAGAYLPQSVALEMRILKDEGKPDAVRFHGPPVDLPAIWTMPFYDCGYSNKWLVSAVSPVVDIARSAAMRERARHQLEASGATDDVNSLRALQSIGKYIAAVSVDLDFNKIDISQCDGDTQFNAFANTHKCKNTTVCEPTTGHGFKRGGYRCVCKPGFKLPAGVSAPWSGELLESAPEATFTAPTQFQCVEIADKEMLTPAISQAAFDQPPMQMMPGQLFNGGPMSSASEQQFMEVPFSGSDAMDRQQLGGGGDMGSGFMPDPAEMQGMQGFSGGMPPRRPLGGGRGNGEGLSVPPGGGDMSHMSVSIMPASQFSGGEYQGPGGGGDIGPSRTKRNAAPADPVKVIVRPHPTGAQTNSAAGSNVAVGVNTENANAIPPQISILEDLLSRLDAEANPMHKLRSLLDTLSPQNCTDRPADDSRVDLKLNDVLAQQMSRQFQPQVRTALRLAHFLSNYLQQNITKAKVAGKLSEAMIRAEMTAVIVAEPSVGAMSIAFEENAFPNKRYYAPTALYNKVLDELQFYHYSENYTSSVWYNQAKRRIAGLKLRQFKADLVVPLDATSTKYNDVKSLAYAAVSYDDVKLPVGPYYDCFYLEKFAFFEVPFFSKQAHRIKLAGIVSIGINPEFTDVNQCDGSPDGRLAGSDRCNRLTTNCAPIKGHGLRAGGYKCECKEGYEYPYNDGAADFNGMRLEMDYHNKLVGLPNNFDNLKCRKPGTLINPKPDLGTRQLPLPSQRPTFIGSSREPDENMPRPPSTFVPPPSMDGSGRERRPLLPTPPNGSMRPPAYVEPDTPAPAEGADKPPQQPPVASADDSRHQQPPPSPVPEVKTPKPATTTIEIRHRPSDSENEIATNRTTTKKQHVIEANGSSRSLAVNWLGFLTVGFYLVNSLYRHNRVALC